MEMTALPEPGRLLTIADYAALPEDDRLRWELVEGSLVMSPSPTPRRTVAVGRLFSLLDDHLPRDLVVVPDVDLDLGLADERSPGTARRPDLVVVTRSEYRRVGADGELLRANAARLVVEIVSEGSRRTDRVFKRSDYADAGIPNYWIIDLDPPVSLLELHLTGPGGYQDSGDVTSSFETAQPFAVRIDLDKLG